MRLLNKVEEQRKDNMIEAAKNNTLRSVQTTINFTTSPRNDDDDENFSRMLDGVGGVDGVDGVDGQDDSLARRMTGANQRRKTVLDDVARNIKEAHHDRNDNFRV